MRHARIQSGIVCELIDFDPAGRFHPSITWAACDETVAVGDSYTDGTFGPPPPPSAEEVAAAAAAAQDAADRENAKQFARLVALRAMSPAEVSGYISNRYPAPAANLAEANTILTKMRDDLETLAIAVSVLARKL